MDCSPCPGVPPLAFEFNNPRNWAFSKGRVRSRRISAPDADFANRVRPDVVGASRVDSPFTAPLTLLTPLCRMLRTGFLSSSMRVMPGRANSPTKSDAAAAEVSGRETLIGVPVPADVASDP